MCCTNGSQSQTSFAAPLLIQHDLGEKLTSKKSKQDHFGEEPYHSMAVKIRKCWIRWTNHFLTNVRIWTKKFDDDDDDPLAIAGDRMLHVCPRMCLFCVKFNTKQYNVSQIGRSCTGIAINKFYVPNWKFSALNSPHFSNDQSSPEWLRGVRVEFLGLCCQKWHTTVWEDESYTGDNRGSGVMPGWKLGTWLQFVPTGFLKSLSEGETYGFKSSDSKRTNAGVVHPYVTTDLSGT